MSNLSSRLALKSTFLEQEPQMTGPDGLSQTWITRGGNFAICVSEVEAGAVLNRANDPEERMLILPPGPSTITALTEGKIAQIYSKASEDIVAAAVNAATYADGGPELAEPDLWPEPHDGFKLRYHPLAKHFDPNGDRIQPRCFRSTNMLVNIFGHYFTRRDTTALSLHWHDDFEQASLMLNGTWVHHMRYNWGANLSE